MTLFTSEKHMTHKVSRLLIILACAGALSLFSAAAGEVNTCSDNVTDNGALYFDGSYSCQIGDKIFSNFTYTDSATGGANAIGASGVTVSAIGPNDTSVTGANIGLQFSAGWTASAGQTSDAAIGFTVTVTDGAGMVITDLGLAQLGGARAPGSASVAEEACGPAPCNPLSGQYQLLTLQPTSPSQTSDEQTTSPTGSVEVAKDISVTGGANGTSGFATLSLVQDTFSQSPVPEPRTVSLLLGFALAAGLKIKNKIQSSRS
jgi:hypothetical protein